MPDTTLDVRVYRTLDELARIRQDWGLLVPKTRTASIFSTWEWLAPWWKAYAAHLEFLALGFWTRGGNLVGLALLEISRRRSGIGSLRVIRLMGDGSYDSDRLDVPVLVGYETSVAEAFLEYLRQHSRDWDTCELNTLPSDSALANVLVPRLGSGWTHSCSSRPGAVIPLPDSWPVYLEGISKKERDKLRYYMRRLEKGRQVVISKCSAVEELPEWLEDLYRLHQKRWARVGETGTLVSDQRRHFYEGMAASFLGRGWLEFWRLRVDGKTAATQFAFRYGSSVFALQEGFDPDYYSDGVGYVLRGHVLKELIAQGATRYDFLAGENTSKARWGTQSSSYLDLHLARSFTRGALYVVAVHRGGMWKEWLRAHIPGRVWAGARRIYRAARPVNAEAAATFTVE